MPHLHTSSILHSKHHKEKKSLRSELANTTINKTVWKRYLQSHDTYALAQDLNIQWKDDKTTDALTLLTALSKKYAALTEEAKHLNHFPKDTPETNKFITYELKRSFRRNFNNAFLREGARDTHALHAKLPQTLHTISYNEWTILEKMFDIAAPYPTRRENHQTIFPTIENFFAPAVTQYIHACEEHYFASTPLNRFEAEAHTLRALENASKLGHEAGKRQLVIRQKQENANKTHSSSSHHHSHRTAIRTSRSPSVSVSSLP